MLLGGAALTRTYVERDLREVYEGRLFYGKDAFEGLRVMDRLGEIKRDPSADDPDWGRVPSDSTVRAARPLRLGRDDRAADVDLPDRSPEVEADNEIFVPPFTGSKVVKGIALDDIAAYINETALFRNQWQFRPEKPTAKETDERVQGPHPPDAARAAGQGREPTDLLDPAGRLRLLPANGDGNDVVIWNDESRDGELTRFRFPRSHAASRTCASPTSSGRSSPTRSTTSPSTS